MPGTDRLWLASRRAARSSARMSGAEPCGVSCCVVSDARVDASLGKKGDRAEGSKDGRLEGVRVQTTGDLWWAKPDTLNDRRVQVRVLGRVSFDILPRPFPCCYKYPICVSETNLNYFLFCSLLGPSKREEQLQGGTNSLKDALFRHPLQLFRVTHIHRNIPPRQATYS